MIGTIGHGKLEYKNFDSLYDERYNGVWTIDIPVNTLQDDGSVPKKILDKNKEKNILIILENLYSNEILYQKIECQGIPYSYIRMATKLENNVSRQNIEFNNKGTFKFTEWKRESFLTDSNELITKLSKFSKAYANNKYLRKEKKIEDRLFRYKNRIKLSQVDEITSTGFYSIATPDTIENISEKEFLKRNLLSINNGELEYDVRSKEVHYEYEKNNPSKYIINGVLEVYNMKEVIFQRLFISFPIIHHLSRYYNKTTKKWSWWRGLETVELLGTSTWLNPRLNQQQQIPCYTDIKIEPIARINVTQGYTPQNGLEDFKSTRTMDIVWQKYNPNISSAPLVGSNVLGYVSNLSVKDIVGADSGYNQRWSWTQSGGDFYLGRIVSNKYRSSSSAIKLFPNNNRAVALINDPYWTKNTFPLYKQFNKVEENIPYTSSLAFYWDVNHINAAVSYRKLKYQIGYISNIFTDEYSSNY